MSKQVRLKVGVWQRKTGTLTLTLPESYSTEYLMAEIAANQENVQPDQYMDCEEWLLDMVLDREEVE